MTEEIKQVEETTTEEVAAETVVEAEENVEQLPANRQRGRKKRVETQEVKPESEWKEQPLQSLSAQCCPVNARNLLHALLLQS